MTHEHIPLTIPFRWLWDFIQPDCYLKCFSFLSYLCSCWKNIKWTDYHVLAKHQSCSIFPCNIELKLFLICRTQLFLIRRVILCGESAQLRQRVSSILQRVCSTLQQDCSATSAGLVIFAYLLCEKFLPSLGPFILHTPWRVPLFTLHSVQERPLYPVFRVYVTLSTLDSALLCNSEILYRIVILWLCTA